MPLSEVKKADIKLLLEKIWTKLHWLTTPYGTFPSKPGDGGDDTLWLGLLSTVGVVDAQEGLKYCQAKDGEKRPGMFYRNPMRRYNDNVGHAAYFSRDMATGVMCYFACGLGNYSQALDWQHYWESQKYCIKKWPWPGKGCMISAYKFAPDDRSDITPVCFAMLRRIWKARGWNTTNEMERWKGSDGDYSVLESKTCPVGFQLHLKAVQAYIKMLVGQSSYYSQKVAEICYERSPRDLFYKILSQGRAIDEDYARFVQICESAPKEFGKNWLWGSSTIDDRISEVCGWDLYFMGKLLLKMG